MSIAIGIALATLVIAMMLERKRHVVSGNLIDLQAEIRRRAEASIVEEDDNR
jgi:hypothetical protein